MDGGSADHAGAVICRPTGDPTPPPGTSPPHPRKPGPTCNIYTATIAHAALRREKSAPSNWSKNCLKSP
jgi:hypothetical protein